MSVFKRKTSRGETKEYHYRFMSKGKLIMGVCEGCQTKKAAEEYEKEFKRKASEIASQKTVQALIENHRQELTGGTTISLDNAFDLSLAATDTVAQERHISESRARWDDFLAFLRAKHPQAVSLADIDQQHVVEYLNFLQREGRFDKTVTRKAGEVTSTFVRSGKLSPRSINAYHIAIRAVFNRLADKAGLVKNPFKNLKKAKKDPIPRKAFTADELKLIRDNLDGDAFVRPIFIVAAATGLREGDICTLRWDEVDLRNALIERTARKTSVRLEIPILPALTTFLQEQRQLSGESEYVLPDQAMMYLSNPAGISYRVKRFLESIGIKTTVQGAGKKVSIRDVHSLRHTFAFTAGRHGIPIEVVRKILGHMDDEMTSHYMAHETHETARAQLAKMPDLLSLPAASGTDHGGEETVLRNEVAALLEQATVEQLEAAKRALIS